MQWQRAWLRSSAYLVLRLRPSSLAPRGVCCGAAVRGLRRFDYRGIPIPIVRNLTRHMLVALDYMHR